jgi:hypothetical protein
MSVSLLRGFYLAFNELSFLMSLSFCVYFTSMFCAAFCHLPGNFEKRY